MPRRGQVKPQKTEADAIYSSKVVTKLINSVMRDGKKTIAEKQVYKAFDLIAEKTKKDALSVFNEAIDKIKPTTEVRPRRVGGAAYQVPMPVRGPRKESLAIRWLIAASRARANKDYHTFSEKLAAEIVDAAAGEGGAIKKRQDVEKMAEANRAFAHFRW